MTNRVDDELVRCRALEKIIADLERLGKPRMSHALTTALEFLRVEREAAYRQLGRKVAKA